MQCDLVENQYQKSRKCYILFILNKSQAYLLNVEPSNLVFLKTYITEFDNITITITDQNSILLETEDKVSLMLLINK